MIPNLLFNGATGIAAGYATNIPPYNLKEVCSFLSAFIDNRKMPIKQIMEYLPGPDFPTGAIIHGKDEIKNIYETGKGRLTIRSKYEQTDVNDKTTLIRFTEIPYDVNKSNLLRSIDEIKEKNKSDLRMKQIIQERETISNRPLTLKERNKLLDELAFICLDFLN